MVRYNVANGWGPSNLGGGGILLRYNGATSIIENEIYGNFSYYYGGGIEIYQGPDPVIQKNAIYLNSTSEAGGGIAVHGWQGEQMQVNLIGNTLTANDCFIGEGSGIYANGNNTSVTGINNIVWGNTGGAQIYLPNLVWMTYCDVQGGYPGLGNINADPLFVNPTSYNYHLQWGSPCIDSGNPDPQYNDPDSTRADMGAFFFDQTGLDPPVIISFYPTNLDTVHQGEIVDFGVQAYDPNGDSLSYHWTLNGTVIGRDSTISIQFDTLGRFIVRAFVSDGIMSDSVRWDITVVPENSPPIIISYYPLDLDTTVTYGSVIHFGINAYDPDGDSLSYFWVEHQLQVWWEPTYTITFDSLGTNIIWAYVTDGELSDSVNWVVTVVALGIAERPVTPDQFIMNPIHPNPFNETAHLSYALPYEQDVQVNLFNQEGKLVNNVFSGRQASGYYQMTLSGSELTSGIYFCRIRTAEGAVCQKVVLLK